MLLLVDDGNLNRTARGVAKHHVTMDEQQAANNLDGADDKAVNYAADENDEGGTGVCVVKWKETSCSDCSRSDANTPTMHH